MTPLLFTQAFLRSPLSTTMLEQIIRIMNETKRSDLIYSLLEQALLVSPLNAYCRQKVMELENRHAELRGKWGKKFVLEHKSISKLQAKIRGILFRLEWKRQKERLNALKATYEGILARLKKLMAVSKSRRKRMLLRAWRDAYLRHRERYWDSTVIIQSYWRMYTVRKVYLQNLARFIRANQKYVALSVMQYESKRLKHLLVWHKLYVSHRLINAANRIISTLRAIRNKGNFIVTSAMISKVLFIRKCNRFEGAWTHWRQTYQRRLYLHSRTTIRFCLREALLRRRRRKNELRIIILDTEVRNMVLRRKWPLAVKLWAHWKDARYARRVARAYLCLTKQWPVVLARRHVRSLRSWRRSREEVRYFLERRWWYRQVKKCYVWWRQLRAILPIQRFVRTALARIKLSKRRKAIRAATLMHHKNLSKRKAHYCQRWLFFVRLRKMECHLSARRIARRWRLHVARSNLDRLLKRKLRSFALIHTCHRLMLWKAFCQLVRGVRQVCFEQVLTPLFHSYGRRQMQGAIQHLRAKVEEQKTVQSLFYWCVLSRLHRVFWFGANVAVSTVRGLGSWTEKFHHEVLFRRWERWQRLRRRLSVNAPKPLLGASSSNTLVHPWETAVSPRLVLIQVKDFSIVKAFRVWIAMYRMRLRLERELAVSSTRVLSNSVFQVLSQRRRCCIKIQSFFRALEARLYRMKLSKMKRLSDEKFGATEAKHIFLENKRTLLKMISTVERRMNGRISLQCFWRCVRAQRERAKRFQDSINLRKAQSLAACLGGRMEMRRVFTAFRIVYISLSSSIKALSAVKPSKKPRKLEVEDTVDSEDSALGYPGQQNHSRRKDRVAEKASRLDFQSVQFQRHLNLLELGGAFVWDYSNCATAPEKRHAVTYSSSLPSLALSRSAPSSRRSSGVPPSLPSPSPQGPLTINEVCFLIENAETLFCEGRDVKRIESKDSPKTARKFNVAWALRLISRRFLGSKLVFCGGSFDLDAVTELYYFLLSKISATEPGEQSEENTVEADGWSPKARGGWGFVLHFSDVHVPFEGIRVLAKAIVSGTALTELSVDEKSLGELGLALVIAAVGVGY